MRLYFRSQDQEPKHLSYFSKVPWTHSPKLPCKHLTLTFLFFIDNTKSPLLQINQFLCLLHQVHAAQITLAISIIQLLLLPLLSSLPVKYPPCFRDYSLFSNLLTHSFSFSFLARNSPSGLPGLQDIGQAELKHIVLPHH